MCAYLKTMYKATINCNVQIYCDRLQSHPDCIPSVPIYHFKLNQDKVVTEYK